jgi:hypothetical protein
MVKKFTVIIEPEGWKSEHRIRHCTCTLYSTEIWYDFMPTPSENLTRLRVRYPQNMNWPIESPVRNHTQLCN